MGPGLRNPYLFPISGIAACRAIFAFGSSIFTYVGHIASRGATHERGTLDARREKQGCQDRQQPSDHQLRDDGGAIPVRRARQPAPARGVRPASRGPNSTSTLTVAFLLNIAIILFGWRRSKDLREALDAYEEAERLAQTQRQHRPRHRPCQPPRADARARRHARGEEPGRPAAARPRPFQAGQRPPRPPRRRPAAQDAVADTIKRASPDGACCARIGGDEFAVLLEWRQRQLRRRRSRGRSSRELSTPVFLGGAQAMVSASIGLASIGRSQNEEDVLRQSDVALYAAKRAGRNCLAWFDKELERELTERLKLEEDIRRGIQARRVRPLLPAADRPSTARAGRLRGARPLALADPRLPRGRSLHRDRRSDRADRPADASASWSRR